MASTVGDLIDRISDLELERRSAWGRWRATDGELVALNAALRDAVILAARDPEQTQAIAALQTTSELALSLETESTTQYEPSERGSPDSLDVCNVIAQWAEAAGVTTATDGGAGAVYKSDLLKRLVYGGEAGPSRTRCPVHHGVWSGLASGSPGDPDPDAELQAMWDAGCRCGTHIGSNSWTGWNPDRYCCVRD